MFSHQFPLIPDPPPHQHPSVILENILFLKKHPVESPKCVSFKVSAHNRCLLHNARLHVKRKSGHCLCSQRSLESKGHSDCCAVASTPVILVKRSCGSAGRETGGRKKKRLSSVVVVAVLTKSTVILWNSFKTRPAVLL